MDVPSRLDQRRDRPVEGAVHLPADEARQLTLRCL
jgi:hypothetical protein